jgi:hypothetical protein
MKKSLAEIREALVDPRWLAPDEIANVGELKCEAAASGLDDPARG